MKTRARLGWFAVVPLLSLSCRRTPKVPDLEETAELAQAHRLANQQLDAGSITGADAADESAYQMAFRSGKPALAARFLTNRGALAFAQSHYRTARQLLLRSRQLSQDAGDRPGEALALGNLASLYIQTGDFEGAKLAAKHGLEFAGENELFPGMRAQLLLNEGTAMAKLDERDGAEACFEQAIEAAAQIGRLGVEGNAWDALGLARMKRGDLVGAEPALLNGYRLYLVGSKSTLPSSLSHLSELWERKGNLAEARLLIDHALEGEGSGISAWYLRFQQARIMSKQGSSEEALRGFRNAVSMASTWREDIAPTDAARSDIFNWLGELYEQYLDELLLDPSIEASGSARAVEAFQAAEEQRSAALRKTLLDSSRTRQNMPDEYWETLARLRLSAAFLATRSTPELQASTLELRKKLDQMEADQFTSEPRRGAMLPILSTDTFIPSTHPFEPRENFYPGNTLRDIQGRLGPNELLLSFHFGSRASCVWACTRGHFEVHLLRARGPIQEAASAFRDAVASASPNVTKLGLTLFDELLGGVSPALRAYPNWTFTADETIARIPVVALRELSSATGETYLIEKHSVHFIPTALMRRSSPGPAAVGGFLGFGDGVYNLADPRWANAAKPAPTGASEYPTLPRLVGSLQELEVCSRPWGNEARVFTGFDLTRQRLLAEVERHPAIIHLAAHVVEAGSPDEAVIDLGLKPDGRPEMLTRYDVSNLRLSGGVVVMSGCGSAAAAAPEGTGLLGLARAWLIAGAGSVVGSRWGFPDDTGALFKSFYEELRRPRSDGSAPVALALQRAELEMLRSKTWRSKPQYWASFYEIGKE